MRERIKHRPPAWPRARWQLERKLILLLTGLGEAAERPQSLSSPHYLLIGLASSLTHECWIELRKLRVAGCSPGKRRPASGALSYSAVQFWCIFSRLNFLIWKTKRCTQASVTCLCLRAVQGEDSSSPRSNYEYPPNDA